MRSMEKNGIVEGVIWRQLLAFFFPILLGTLFQQLYNTVDAVVIGRFAGKAALASVGGSAEGFPAARRSSSPSSTARRTTRASPGRCTRPSGWRWRRAY